MVKCYQKDYPRPQFVREQWQNLNGAWDFAFDDANRGEALRWYRDFPAQRRQIQVPFTYETKSSGIQDESYHPYLWYRRELTAHVPAGNRMILHFEGSDYLTKVWVNGCYVGCHRGGYARFSFDITDYVTQGSNELVVRVEDTFDLQQPRGKQRWIPENFGCWYVQTSGIWKTVWTEYVPACRLSHVKMTPDLDNARLELEFEVETCSGLLDGDLMVEAEITYRGRPVTRLCTAVSGSLTRASADVAEQCAERFDWLVHLWTPETPNLYDVTFRLLRGGEILDAVGSYFAMRKISIGGPNVYLNEKVLYQRLILDQGYWKDSHLTPPSEEALIEDIEKIRAMGYNGLRKHQKIEDERFLYWCDVKGMLVWSEAPAAYRYSDYAVSVFAAEWLEILRQNYNHPCIITWTPFNESWGIRSIRNEKLQQHFTEAIYYLTKSIDPNRPVITNDGWEHTVSDILTLHDYEASGEKLKDRYLRDKEEILYGGKCFNTEKTAFADGFSYRGQPVIISEFGGIAFDNGEAGWGYGEKVSGQEAFVRRYDAVTSAIKALPYVCGYCYTQVTDVQQEINGLMDMERNFKVDPAILKEINERKP